MTDTVTWEAPGPGTWERDASHAPPAGTPVYRRIVVETPELAYRQVFEDFGAPLDTIQLAMVHGGLYRRLVPLVGADKGGAPPPKPVLWLAARLHPLFRKRNKLALEVQATKRHLEPLTAWETGERQSWIDRNRALQSEDVADVDDAALADHLERVDANAWEGNLRHHVLHGTDMGPIGELLVQTDRWGLDPVGVMSLLRGYSPATVEAAVMGAHIAEAMRSEGADPTAVSSLDDIRSAGPASSAALDDYLDLYGWRIVSSYDIEGLAVVEIPGSVVALVRANADGAPDDGGEVDAAAAELRGEVPEADRAAFDDLLDTARRAYGLRDDNGPLTAEWPLGLLRRAFLESGKRLHGAGRISSPERVFELDTPELVGMLRGQDGPSAAELDERAAYRAWEATLEPPMLLGDPPQPPDPSALPRGLRTVTEMVVRVVETLEKEPGGRPLEGIGIGDQVYTGRARLASKPEDVLATFEPGDVLVASWTAPTYNAVIASAGAMVIEEGGLLCHAAVMARELGVPAVIGASDAMTLIEEGASVTVDPVAGAVTVG